MTLAQPFRFPQIVPVLGVVRIELDGVGAIGNGPVVILLA